MAIGNAIALVASIIMVITGLIKNKRKIIAWQTIEIIIAGIGYIVLGGYVAAINMGIGVIRNILCYKEKLTISAKLILSVLYAIVAFAFNDAGIIGLTLLAGSIATLFIIDIKNVMVFKLLGICGMFVWAFYDFSVQSYTTFAFDIGTIIALTISMVQIKFGKVAKINESLTS